MRVAHEEARDVRPVFINSRFSRSRNDCARYVRAAAGEGFDLAAGHTAVKTGNDCIFVKSQLVTQGHICFVCIEISVLVEEYEACGVNEIKAEERREKL